LECSLWVGILSFKNTIFEKVFLKHCFSSTLEFQSKKRAVFLNIPKIELQF
jgi:hypothetical protein